MLTTNQINKEPHIKKSELSLFLMSLKKALGTLGNIFVDTYRLGNDDCIKLTLNSEDINNNGSNKQVILDINFRKHSKVPFITHCENDRKVYALQMSLTDIVDFQYLINAISHHFGNSDNEKVGVSYSGDSTNIVHF